MSDTFPQMDLLLHCSMYQDRGGRGSVARMRYPGWRALYSFLSFAFHIDIIDITVTQIIRLRKPPHSSSIFLLAFPSASFPSSTSASNTFFFGFLGTSPLSCKIVPSPLLCGSPLPPF